MIRKTRVWLPLVLLALTLSGCTRIVVSDGAVVGTEGFLRGTLRSVVDVGMNHVWTAALQTIHALELNVLEKEKDALTANLHAVGAEDKDIHIHLKSLDESHTEIRIRVNTFGNRTISNRILQEIQARLPIDSNE